MKPNLNRAFRLIALVAVTTAAAGVVSPREAKAWDVFGCQICWNCDTLGCLGGKIGGMMNQLGQNLSNKLNESLQAGRNAVQNAFAGFNIFGCGIDWGNIGNTANCVWKLVNDKFEEGKRGLMNSFSNVGGCPVNWGNLWETANCVTKKVTDAAGKLGQQLTDASNAFVKKAEDFLNQHIGKKVGCPIKLIPINDLVGNAGKFMACAGNKIIKAATDFVDGIKKKAMETINGWIATAKQKIWDGAIKPAIDKLKEYAMNAVGGLVNQLVEKVMGSRVAKWIQEAVAQGKSAYGYLKHKLNNLHELLEDLALDQLIDWARGEGLAKIIAFAQPLIRGVLDSAKTVLSGARNAIQGFIGSIPIAGGALAAAVGVAYDAALTAIFGACDSGVVGYLKDLAVDIANNVKRFVKENLTDPKSPIGAVAEAIRGPIRTLVDRAKPLIAQYTQLADQLRQVANTK